MNTLQRSTLFLLFVAGIIAMTATCEETSVGRSASSSPIDKLVFGKLDELGIPRSPLCSDEVFVRRVFIDVIGTLPRVKEVKEFLSDNDADKRVRLIDRLLARDEFAEYWAMKWCDLLKVKAEFPSNLWPNGAQAYHEWIRESIRQNKPYDKFARELLVSNGSNFRVPPVNFYRALPSHEPQKILDGVALTFMGMRSKDWSEGRRAGAAAFFGGVSYKKTGEWKEEIVYYDPDRVYTNPVTGKPQKPVFPDGSKAVLLPGVDPRIAFADWLVDKDNPYFARCAVNRVWCWLLGRGIIHEPDDIRPDNPPQNLKLLSFLEKELVGNHYDLKHIYRLILNSQVYQFSSEPLDGNRNDVSGFSHYYIRRLEAEVLLDAVCQITATDEKYMSPIPEPFTYIEGQRAVSLADGSITSPFLELFGRSSRDTGYDSERNNGPSVTQRLHMLNSTHIQEKLRKGPGLRNLMKNINEPSAKAQTLYLAVLSRYPTEEELKIIRDYFSENQSNRGDAHLDVAWALFNSKEFLFRH